MSDYLHHRPWTRGTRPAPTRHAPLPPFDTTDGEGNLVHTVLPPEQVIPEHFTDPAWLRADFSGVTLPGDYSPTQTDDIKRVGGVQMTSGPWTGLFVPFLQGANTTPPTMIMTPMLSLYPRDVQDAVLTEHAERAYDDMVVAPEVWNDVGNVTTDSSMLDWCQYVRSWGFRVVLWRGDHKLGLDRRLLTLLDAGVVSFYVHGKEVDSNDTSEGYEASLQMIDAHIGGRLPIGVHFSDDEDSSSNHYGLGYPVGMPRDTFLNDWSPYDGRVHCCLQLGSRISAGRQGAGMWYARQHVNCGIGDAARGPGAPNSRVIAFEVMATAQLYGEASEEVGCLRTHELLCGTRDNSKARPVSGFCNGGRQPNGDPR